MNALVENIWLVPLYPLIAAFIIILGRWTKLLPVREIAMLLTVGATLLGLVHAGGALQWLLQNPQPAPIEVNWLWLSAGPLQFKLGYLLDAMSVMMLLVVTFISMFIQIYTHGYMNHDKGYCRFYAFLALFNFSMLGLVLSTNLFQMYIFWELVGLCSFLLIGFWFTREAAAKACLKAFLMNRVGDFGLLIGILAFVGASFPWWQQYLSIHPGQALLSFQAFEGASHYVLGAVGPGLFAVIALLIFMGPMAKSAQVPLHTWLPDAMEGPTPISALIHAATMVAAGVYLVGRVYPIFELSPVASNVVAGIGTVTAVIAATIALVQTDIKKALAYSTISQLGFMMAAMGVGAYTAGLFHLFTHAFFKAMLFLGSGSVIHACDNEQDMRNMGGLLKYLPITGWTYLIGTLSISGFLLSGFWSKDMILVGALNHPIVFAILSFTAGLTAFYMFRTFFMTFTGKYRGAHHPHHEDPVMVTPLLVLAIPSLLIGFLLSGNIPSFPSFAQYIHTAQPEHLSALQESVENGFKLFGLNSVALTSLGIGIAGAFIAYLFYGLKPVFSANAIRQRFEPLYTLYARKWYFDEFYQGIVDKVYLPIANSSFRFDRGFIDGLVNWTGGFVVASGSALKLVQTGGIQLYVAVLAVGFLVLSFLFMYQVL